MKQRLTKNGTRMLPSTPAGWHWHKCKSVVICNVTILKKLSMNNAMTWTFLTKQQVVGSTINSNYSVIPICR